MHTVVNFSPELGSWITAHLDSGHTPTQLIEVMQAQQMEAAAAQAIMAAFVKARRNGHALPLQQVPLHVGVDTDALVHLPATHVINTHDRRITVTARAARPALALLSNVLSAAECAELIALARPRLHASTIVDRHSGADIISPTRSSQGMFFRLKENPFIAGLDRRLAEIMNLPLENGEGIQILYYPNGAGSAPHYDFLLPETDAVRASLARSGQRCSTLVCYLNEVEAGGETVFPETDWRIAPIPGNALYFEYVAADGTLDYRSLHASSPVQAGEKWVATKWMREKAFVSA
ncbi:MULTISPECIES: 2OG-Fe(II) oxygenase [unclassified Undibacterium]|uniref:2OG-Fe(II) oxygenase n=1 Tax=unclassified Undibacterium TaxID=2630295 RepID=UPI002AC9CDF5|nr:MULTISPECIES: 2OG-Fe(II) oxygenase [unclassified Undibacterium]MEB0140106.1 2OG-Fe(II) oxygenase [Undibacterium sp. CCC2.1]MEB0173216.1 2OG-Fe(II) oxygenase [Undibacterium sp. CCC1.1]MEB0176923.1 2OG-Fe(II) oxygenase [Undibacterium sp. CCC3.4]MEB0216256.1 2OG-Fe(II) oxygenase [Undibacterium sp. 5I2]WPX44160.1 2OG-Fe(II) oxygenase [Undibacterium sp. CCC3.4]